MAETKTTFFNVLKNTFASAIEMIDSTDSGMLTSNGLYVCCQSPQTKMEIISTFILPENTDGIIQSLTYINIPDDIDESTAKKLGEMVHHYNIAFANHEPGFMEYENNIIVWSRSFSDPASFNIQKACETIVCLISKLNGFSLIIKQILEGGSIRDIFSCILSEN